MSEGSVKAAGAGLAGGAIVAALLETLVDRNVLTLPEAKNVLDRAQRSATLNADTPEGAEAAAIITSVLRGWSPAR